MAAKTHASFPGGLKMDTIGIGTWQSKDPVELEVALNAALEIGYRHIDTAFVYENEEVIGRVLKQWFDSGKLKREDLFITTKLPFHGIHPDRVELFLKKSLQNLQLDYVDLYLEHFPVCGQMDKEGRPLINAAGEVQTENVDHVAVWKKMEEQVDAGRTKSIGLSNFTAPQIDKILKSARIKPACLQSEIHLFMQQRNLVDFCQKNGIVVVAYSPLGSPGFNTFLKELGKGPKELPNILNNKVVAEIAKKHKKTPAQIALRHLLQRNIVAIPKSVKPQRLKENIDVYDFTLDDGDMKALNDLEVGPSTRVCDWPFNGLSKNPEYPFNWY